MSIEVGQFCIYCDADGNLLVRLPLVLGLIAVGVLVYFAVQAWATRRQAPTEISSSTNPPMKEFVMEAVFDQEDHEITDPCSCNQPDENRVSVHQRGHHGFCRDTNELGAVAAAE